LLTREQSFNLSYTNKRQREIKGRARGMKDIKAVSSELRKWLLESVSDGSSIRKIFCVAFLLILLCPTAQAESLFIMGWDGAGMNNVVPLLEEGKLPNLKSIIDNGGCLTHVENISCTYTTPNWTEAFTGLTYDQSKAKNNDTWKVVPYENTIVKAVQDKGHRIGWFVSKVRLDSNTHESSLANIALRADSYSYATSQGNDNYIVTLSQKVISFVEQNTEYLVFLHVNPDYYGHKYGENSARYLYEFERADYWLGQILSNIDRMNTRVIVVSDHGFNEGTFDHSDAPDNFVVTDIPLKSFYCTGETTGTMRDVANTILEYYGIDWTSRIPTMRGKSLLQR
jgi:hypothetical protein